MKTLFVYPGSFSPPTYGHLCIVKQAATITPELIIICSTNEDKNNIFTEEESVTLWQAYKLPPNVRVLTFASFLAEGINPKNIVMVRGIRDSQDFDYEKKVAFLNRDNFGIDKFLYIMSNPETENISSSAARKAAEELRLVDLAKLVAPRVATALLEKTLHIKNLVLVVGRPGSGKSTFLRQLTKLDPQNIHINTDEFNHQLKPILQATFGAEDLATLILTREAEIQKVIAPAWMKLLTEALRKVPANSNVFIEVPYAFKPNMRLDKLFGGKTIYFDCQDVSENERRLKARATPHLNSLITTIPDWAETQRLAEEENLQIGRIDTSGNLSKMKKRAKLLVDMLTTPRPLFPFPNSNSNLVFGLQRIPCHHPRPSFSTKDRQHIRSALD